MEQGSGKNLEIKQFRYSSDNLGYLIYSRKNAVAVDGGAADNILDFLKEHDLRLLHIINTHSHGDHTVGNQQLLRKTDAEYIDYKTLLRIGIELDNNPIGVYRTPGHTADSVVFKIDDVLLTGDTLFIGKVGKCFTGNIEVFLESIKLIMKFSDNTVIFPGHDYVMEYLEFIKEFEPDNRYIDEMKREYDPELVKSSLGFEKKLNPFLRINDKNIISCLENRGLPVKTELERWESMISLM